jgi:UPF0755 protein
MSEENGSVPLNELPVVRSRTRGFLRRSVLKSPAAAIHPESVPLPPEPEKNERPERPITNFVSGLLSFLVIALFIVVGAFIVAQRQISAPGSLAADRVVIVRGSIADVVDQLEREGVTDKGFLLTLYWQLTGKSAQIKGGEYLFRKEASLEQITETLIEGKSILHSVTVPEGRTSDEIVDILRSSVELSGDIKDVPKEGTLLPETYKFARGMTRIQMLDHMAQDQVKLVREIWAKRSSDLPLSSPLDLVTLASVVEKETGKADERPRVAAVFLNRLRAKMPLQSDPTVIYGLVGGKGSLGHGLTKSELQQATPYNTYLIPGLPAGPITNPGRAALEAVANPSQTKEQYFVADGTGGHVFAETLEQHQKNVLKWRQIESDKPSDTGQGTVVGGPKVVAPAEATDPSGALKVPSSPQTPAAKAKPVKQPAKKKPGVDGAADQPNIAD